MNIKTIFKDGTQMMNKPGSSFSNPEQTLLEIYQNYRDDKKIVGTNKDGIQVNKNFREIKSITIEF